MSLAKASMWTAASTLVKIVAGLLVVKMLAVSYGPAGVGQAGNFRQLITVLGVLAGAGIFNGVTKYVAQYQQQPRQLRAVVGTASSMVLGFSLLLALVFLLFAAPISRALFGHDDYQQVIRIVAFLQMGIAWANLALALMKGFRDAAGNALALIIGSLSGVAAWFVCYWLGGYSGALVGLAMVPALVVVPAFVLLARRDRLPMNYLLPGWQPECVRSLGKFTLMALITAVTLPVAWMMMRNLLAQHAGWQQVGLWQGVSSISDAYLQFITASFSVWLLPTLARLQHKADITREILKALRFVLPVVAAASFAVWLLRDFAIWLLFSSEFHAMRDLFIWQLSGDVLKVGCYVFGYLVIAKASLRFYLLTEVSQFALLSGFSRWLIPLHGAAGAAQAYMATYMAYFALCAGVFIIYRRRV
ncbi:lipid III flippase WzxE [Erwinia pyrifoliae]|uniref:Lipid III flippase n=1 Tax=Erwinia pyrifoliae TaxID=79967 RepID=A0ABY5X941_ERWPY|nr:lipid III flippase WzxE [Erwinia pyrifoliae]AUX74187.1 lipid III flippase WzxE [Erwinia pyrifoliae]MCA8875463.1 lipid III flippase WzxE [Erwinia pyrifoliae]MCT2385245.1 lipid III flippase WzxE [Erwinia pyrifoliae]MCU8585531.1 lipid III flippase WzxE [Erwinia pyrifoliae]UWS33834.1 lipid III flippase WzxE [Erwinia pyrifoliae]